MGAKYCAHNSAEPDSPGGSRPELRCRGNCIGFREVAMAGTLLMRRAPLEMRTQRWHTGSADLRDGARRINRGTGHRQLREPDAVSLQRNSGREPPGLSGLRRVVRAVFGPILDAIKFNYLPFGMNCLHQPIRCRRTSPTRSTGCGLRRDKDTTATRHILARHLVLARQPRTGLGCRTGHAGRRRAVVHGEHADARVALELMGGRTFVAPAAARVWCTTRREPAGPPNAYDENNPLRRRGTPNTASPAPAPDAVSANTGPGPLPAEAGG